MGDGSENIGFPLLYFVFYYVRKELKRERRREIGDKLLFFDDI